MTVLYFISDVGTWCSSAKRDARLVSKGGRRIQRTNCHWVFVSWFGGGRLATMYKPLAILTALLLAGCQTTGAGLVSPQDPPLSSRLAADCRDPGVRAGKPVLGELTRNRVALAECRQTHHDTVKFYNDLRPK